MNKPILELQGVKTIVNKGTSSETTILKGLNLKINEGDFITIVGTNGAGKSTLLMSSAETCTLTKEKFCIMDKILPIQQKNSEQLSYPVFFRIQNWGRLHE